jgi:selenocysteine-specific elongation factor
MFIIGTTGHIDHGKSSLVQALTSIDPDRLPEEKQRGMTIDLGFAWMPFANGETAGFIDVPGHKDFMKNVIAGLWGVNASLLVVAADDGWMPQTQEHLNILNFFNISHGIVALSKVDLVEDQDWLDLVEDDIRAKLANTSLRDSPIIRVSARDGTNIERLRQGIEEVAMQARLHKDIGKPRLYIDRAFTITGSGTVVTGTLIDGVLSQDQKVTIFPGNQECRIRGIESYNRKVDHGQTGCRVAINLAGAKKGDIKRGDIVFDLARQPGSSEYINVRINLLDSQLNLLKDKSEELVYMGTREITATIKLLQCKVLHAGDSSYAQLAFHEPVSTCIGDHFVLRRPSPPLTIGGGTILDPLAEKLKYKQEDFLVGLLDKRINLDLESLILTELEKHRYLQQEGLLENSRYARTEISAAVDELAAEGKLIRANQWLIHRQFWSGLEPQLQEIVAGKHAQAPIEIGVAQAEIMVQLGLPKEIYDMLISRMVSAQIIRLHGAYVALSTHTQSLSREQEISIAEILKVFAERPGFPPTLRDLHELKPDCEALIRYMCRSGLLVEMEDGVLFEGEQYREVRQKIIDLIRANGSISIQTARDAFGYTRKYVIPLFNKLDSEGITLLKNNERVFTTAYLKQLSGNS